MDKVYSPIIQILMELEWTKSNSPIVQWSKSPIVQKVNTVYRLLYTFLHFKKAKLFGNIILFIKRSNTVSKLYIYLKCGKSDHTKRNLRRKRE